MTHGPSSLQAAVAVLCWSGICRLGSIQIGSLGLINTLPFDHESGSPESLLGLRPDINKPPVVGTPRCWSCCAAGWRSGRLLILSPCPLLYPLAGWATGSLCARHIQGVHPKRYAG